MLYNKNLNLPVTNVTLVVKEPLWAWFAPDENPVNLYKKF